MPILFYPPLGEVIHVVVPQFTPRTQTVLLLFTAELDPADHEQLISEGAQVQVWSDIPYGGGTSNTGWGELPFQAAVQFRDTRAISPVPIPTAKKVTLFARTLVPIPESGFQSRYSFTYRIFYPSVDIQWLGTFGLNGSVTLSRDDLRASPGLVLSPRWQLAADDAARTYSLDPGTVSEVVGKISLEDYHVWALDASSFLADATNASLCFLIPKRQTHTLNHSPTYVLAASPQASLSISADGEIITAGGGCLTLKTDDLNLEPDKFIHDLLASSQMDLWKILGHDSNTRTIYLASHADNLPVQLLLIPLGSWILGSLTLDLDLHALIKLFRESDVIAGEIAMYSPRNKTIHLFNFDTETQKPNPRLSFQLDRSGINFIITPVFSLQARDNFVPSSSWKAIFLTPYSIPPQHLISDHYGTLPTPPPPHTQPISRPSQSSYASAVTPCLKASGGLETHNNGTLAVASSPKPYSPHRFIFTIFKCLFPPATMVLRWFRKAIYGGSQPESGANPKHDNNPEITEAFRPVINDTVEKDQDVLQVDHPGRLVDDPLIPPSNVPFQNHDQDPPCPPMLDRSTNSNLQAQKRLLPGGILYAKLYPSWGNTIRRRSTAAIVILKGNASNMTIGVADDVISTPTLQEGVEEISSAVRFLDGGNPECTTRESVVMQHNFSEMESHSKAAFCLLEYDLDWENEQGERVVRISPPINCGP